MWRECAHAFDGAAEAFAVLGGGSGGRRTKGFALAKRQVVAKDKKPGGGKGVGGFEEQRRLIVRAGAMGDNKGEAIGVGGGVEMFRHRGKGQGYNAGYECGFVGLDVFLAIVDPCGSLDFYGAIFVAPARQHS